MTTPDIRLIISDIDGTILNSQHQVSKKLQALMPLLQKRKIPFVLTSARSPKGMAAIADELTLTAPLAAYNGAYIVEQTKKGSFTELFSRPLDFTEANKVIQLAVHSFPEVAVNIYSAAEWFVPAINKWVQQEEAITEMTAKEVILPDFLSNQPPIHKLLFIGSDEDIAALDAAIGRLVLMESTKYRSKSNYLEFTDKTVSKELALRELADYYQVAPNEVMAIGDHDNDLSMIAAAGFGVAMGNASEACKEKANLITVDNDHDGAAVAISDALQLEL